MGSKIWMQTSWIIAIVTGLSISGCAKPYDGSAHLPLSTVQTGDQSLWNQSGDGDATRVYGKAKVKAGVVARVESPSKPWSGYWYSNRSKFLFDGVKYDPSPLQRYDQWVRKAHPHEKVDAVGFEKDKIYNPTSSDDQGLWNAWAVASVLEPEPTSSKKLDGVKFEVGDLKALLVMTYDVLPPGRVISFGQKAADSQGPAWRNIPADQFHRVLQAELFERRHAILLGRNTPATYWIHPVFAGQMNIVKDSVDPHVLHVVTTLTAADYLGDPLYFPQGRNFVGTGQVTFIYTYDLYGIPQEDGSLDVRSGQWTGDSEIEHPDFVSAITDWGLPPEKRRGMSRNTEVKTQFVSEILSRKSDSLIHPTVPGILHFSADPADSLQPDAWDQP